MVRKNTFAESLEVVGVSGTSDENRPLYHVYKSFATWEKRPLFVRMSQECRRLSLDRCKIQDVKYLHMYPKSSVNHSELHVVFT